MKLKNKVALITGGGTGIGEGIAKLFAHEGAQVIISGRREGKLREAADAINAANAEVDGAPDVEIVALDVAEQAAVDEAVAQITSQHGKIDIVVNNAGVNIPDRGLDVLTPEVVDRLLRINATGTFNVIHAVLPQMRERQDGVLISVTSISGIRPSVVAGAAYSASKHAQSALTKSISLEEKDHGIRATVISPGEVNTPILDNRPVVPSDEHRAQILQPEDVAQAALLVATLHPRAHIAEIVIKPTTAAFV